MILSFLPNKPRSERFGAFFVNLGSGALQRSTLRRKVNREEHEDVPPEFLKWVWAGGKKLKGLVKRRNAEALAYSA